jgi:hypothetical protein
MGVHIRSFVNQRFAITLSPLYVPVMDWGMMKTPTVAASMLCHPGFAPLPTSSNSSNSRDQLPPVAVGTLFYCGPAADAVHTHPGV